MRPSPSALFPAFTPSLVAGIAMMAAIGVAAPTSARAQLCAEFNTSLGTFTAELEFTKAPGTVANFVSLAEGSRSWIDLTNGSVRNDPFYDGIIFHRVIDGFMNQTGSPNGKGTDGPGYSFRDEFHPDLRHDGPYVVSMANSGKDTNGSQIFITVEATPWLDDKHSVFGHVVSGTDVVDAINAVETNSSDKPLTPVVIESVHIIRKDEAARAFDVHAHGLPVVRAAENVRLKPIAGDDETPGFELAFARHSASQYRIHHGDSPATPTLLSNRFHNDAPGTETIDVSATTNGQANHFFKIAETSYTTPVSTPDSIDNSIITLGIGVQNLELTLNDADTGTWRLLQADKPDLDGDITQKNWIPGPYNGRLFVRLQGLNPSSINVTLEYADPASGSFTGDFSGDFTHAPVP